MNDVRRRELNNAAVSQLRQLLRGVQGATAPVWLDLDLTKGQLRTLFTLQSCGTTSLGGLAERLGVGAPQASLVVERLVRLGFVQRSVDASDRRRLVLSVAAPGDELLTSLRHGRQQVIEEWLANLTDREVEGLCAGLRPLLETMFASSGGTADAALEESVTSRLGRAD